MLRRLRTYRPLSSVLVAALTLAMSLPTMVHVCTMGDADEAHGHLHGKCCCREEAQPTEEDVPPCHRSESHEEQSSAVPSTAFGAGACCSIHAENRAATVSAERDAASKRPVAAVSWVGAEPSQPAVRTGEAALTIRSGEALPRPPSLFLLHASLLI